MEDRSPVALVSEVYWPDAEVRDILVGYEAVRISLDCADGVRRVIAAEGYIALSILPFWDEQIVARCTLSSDSQLQQSALARLEGSGAFRLDSGSLARNRREFQTLTIVLSDDSEIMVTAQDFRVDDQE